MREQVEIITGRRWLEKNRFDGFLKIRELRTSSLNEVPDSPGVYVILRETGQPPRFLERSTGGHFKEKDPTVPLGELDAAWVPGSKIVYIGKAGHASEPPTLRTRLRQYLEFGRGKPVGHWGGRFIWQLADADDLTVCWRPTGGEEPRDVEQRMLAEFEREHGRLPFANLAR